MTALEQDVTALVAELLQSCPQSTVRLRVGRFWSLFVHKYALKYQKGDRFIVSSRDLLQVVRQLRLSGGPRINCRNVKRLKLNRARLERCVNAE